MHALTALLHLATVVSALPVASIPASGNGSVSEVWDIPTLKVHFMGTSTGLPGNPPWTENPSWEFNSIIDFDATLPNHDDGASTGNLTVNCQASFLNGTLPEGPVPCTGAPADEKVWFAMTLYTGPGAAWRPEVSFVLSMYRLDLKEKDQTSHRSGDQPVTAWVGSMQPTTYLTCIDYQPLDGTRCSINNFMTAGKDLFIEATTTPPFENTAGKRSSL